MSLHGAAVARGEERGQRGVLGGGRGGQEAPPGEDWHCVSFFCCYL